MLVCAGARSASECSEELFQEEFYFFFFGRKQAKKKKCMKEETNEGERGGSEKGIQKSDARSM